MRKTENNAEAIILKKLIRLNLFINLVELLAQNNFSKKEVKAYYRITKYLLYRVFGSRWGYMHMAISSEAGKSDFGYHPKKIAELIKSTGAKNVLELGSGQSANLVYLAKRFSEVSFMGLDLYPSLSRSRRRNNISIKEGDYHNLSLIKSASLDIVYAIETLCYSADKQKVYDEVYRVLKPGGRFVVWDGYLNIPRDRLTFNQQIFIRLLENGFCLDEFEYLGNIRNYEKKFGVRKSENLKEKVLPFSEHNVKQIEKYMKFGFLFKIFCRIFPKKFINNLAPIYLMGDLIKYDLTSYYESTYRK